jgi:hypothetical protein|uniref:Uncharacterized protein n=1 Tax=viral metagenome TaxID=1070528 RepID=A0A6C0AIR3_9ZZZZ
MASKRTLTSAFFDQFAAFATELCEMYPSDADFSLFSNTLSLIKMTNPAMVVSYVVDNVLQFEDKIMKSDESFFLDYDFREYTSHVDMNIFQKLKQYIEKMSPASKQNVWKYIQNIVRLAKAIHSA